MTAYSYDWSGTTFGPFTPAQYGASNAVTVSNGVASIYTGGSPDATKVGGHTYTTAMTGNLHNAEITYSTINNAPPVRGAGVLVGGNSATPTKGIFCNVASYFTGPSSTQIYTLDDGINFTLRAESTTVASTGDSIKLEIANDGFHYVYTVYKNSSVTLSWVDTGDVTNPGKYVGTAFVGGYNFGAWYGPQGATTFKANDDASYPRRIRGISSITGISSMTL